MITTNTDYHISFLVKQLDARNHTIRQVKVLLEEIVDFLNHDIVRDTTTIEKTLAKINAILERLERQSRSIEIVE